MSVLVMVPSGKKHCEAAVWETERENSKRRSSIAFKAWLEA